MTLKQNQWCITFTLCVDALILTTEMEQGFGWVLGWAMFASFSFIKLASHGALDVKK